MVLRHIKKEFDCLRLGLSILSPTRQTFCKFLKQAGNNLNWNDGIALRELFGSLTST